MDWKRERDRRLLAGLHPGFPINEPDSSPDFDAGARMESVSNDPTLASHRLSRGGVAGRAHRQRRA